MNPKFVGNAGADTALAGRQRVFNPKVPPAPPVPTPPKPEDCQLRRRGKGEKGVYWAGKCWCYDDGKIVKPPVFKQVGGNIRDHPQVRERLEREANNMRMRDPLAQIQIERQRLNKERAEFEQQRRELFGG